MSRVNSISFNDFIKSIENPEFVRWLFLEAGYGSEEGSECEYCDIGQYRLINSKSPRFPVGMYYKCSNRACNKQKNIFEESKISNINLKKFLILLASFINNKTISSVIIDNYFDEKTVFKYYSYFRTLCSKNLPENILLGGSGKEVEIDETHLFKRKYHRGNRLASEDIWVFGIFERVSKNIFLSVVKKRDADTLYDIVSSHVLPGTKIYTDGWRGYCKIKQYFTSKSVNHKYYFVDPNDPLNHVNNIERTWRSLKSDMRGACNENYCLHLNEFMFRRLVFTSDLRLDLVRMISYIKDDF